MRSLRRLFVFAAVLAALVWLGQLSGNEPERDAVAAAERELAIALDAGRIDVGELELFVVQAGPADGPPVLLLHGFPEFWYAWHRPMGVLAAAGYRAIAPNQRGYAGSDKPVDLDAYELERLAADAAGLLQALGHESACVVAQDWGGAVAWELALRYPERVGKLFVLDTPHPDAHLGYVSQQKTTSWYRTAFQLPYFPEWLSRLGHWRILTGMLRDSSRPGAFSDAKLELYRSAWDEDGAYGSMVNWYRASFRSTPYAGPARRVSVPTLVAVAADDAFIAGDLTRRSQALLDDGSLLELGSGTHWVVQEEPERIADLLVEWCGSR